MAGIRGSSKWQRDLAGQTAVDEPEFAAGPVPLQPAQEAAEVPYGLRISVDHANLEANPDESLAVAIMMVILQEIVKDQPFSLIAGHLNGQQLKTRIGRDWTSAAVFRADTWLIDHRPTVAQIERKLARRRRSNEVFPAERSRTAPSAHRRFVRHMLTSGRVHAASSRAELSPSASGERFARFGAHLACARVSGLPLRSLRLGAVTRSGTPPQRCPSRVGKRRTSRADPGTPRPWRVYKGWEVRRKGDVAIPPDAPTPRAEWSYARFMYRAVRDDRMGIRRTNWTIDYPRSDRHLAGAINRLTRIRARTIEQPGAAEDGDDIYNYPWLCAVEVGHWDLTDLQKGCQAPRLPAARRLFHVRRFPRHLGVGKLRTQHAEGPARPPDS